MGETQTEILFPTQMEGMRDRSREAIVCAGVGETAAGRQKERRKEIQE